MKVHLLQIPADGKRYEGEESNALLELPDSEIRPISPVRYTLDVGVNADGLWATGTVGVDVECQCVKCLETFARPVEVPNFAVQVELTGAETVDLTQPMREDILLALPAHPHCDWNGAKVCPGAFLPAKPETPSMEPPAESSAVWGALDQLKLNQ